MYARYYRMYAKIARFIWNILLMNELNRDSGRRQQIRESISYSFFKPEYSIRSHFTEPTFKLNSTRTGTRFASSER